MRISRKQCPTIFVPASVQRETISHIRACGEKSAEGFVAWAGVKGRTGIEVRSVLIPQRNGSEEFACVMLSDDSMEHFSTEMITRGETLIAQVHSHPFEAFHSETDNQFPLIHRTGFLSIVIPYFGRYGFEEVKRFRFFEYVSDGQWNALNNKAVKKRLAFEGASKWKKIRLIKNSILGRRN